MFAHHTNPLLYLWGKLWHYSEGNRKKVVLFVSMFTAANIIMSLEPLFIGFFLNEVQVKGVHAENIWYLLALLGLFLVVEVAFWALHGPARLLENTNAFMARANYKKYLLNGVMALPIEWHVDHHSGDTIDKIEKGTSALFSFGESIFQILQPLMMLITSVIALLYFDVVTCGIVLLLSIPTFYMLLAFDRVLIPGYKKVNTLENALVARVFDTISNISTVIILRIEKLVAGTIASAMQKPLAQYTINSKNNELKWFYASLLGRIAVVVVIGIFLWKQVLVGAVLVGTIYILYGYVDQIRKTFFSFAYLYNDIVRYRTSVSNAEEISKDFRPAVDTATQVLPPLWKELTIEGLSFSYHTDESSDLHLDVESMRIERGARIALIGESGGGKSTFLKVVRDLYHPKTLSLSVDGTPLSGGFEDISHSISLVPQDPEIFSTTIRENITLGVDYEEAHIKVFTDMAQFSSVIERLPKGLESSIVEKGVNLSGGEKQRLALVRGLLASEDKDIVLLDEPTSSVDFGNELEIYKNIFEAFPGKTIISSVHRLHLLSLFDQVYFFKGGKIVASGSFEDVRKQSFEFQDLWERYLSAHDATVEG